MKIFNVLPVLLVLAFGFASFAPVLAQGYSYNYGGSRVTKQGSIGLNNHDSTYISPGTISQSAQGINSGYQLNPGLPSVSLGRNVKTAGDNFYYGNAPEKIRPINPTKIIYRNNNNNQQGRQQRPLRPANVYYPGQNASSSVQYGSGGALQYNSGGGAITYSDVDTSNSSNNQNQNQNQKQNQSQNQNQNQNQNTNGQ